MAELKIPKILHQVWVGPLPPPSALMATWRDKHPDWEYRLWTDHTGWQNQAKIDAMPEWNGRADIMRYQILERFGGVAIDADAECVQPLDDSFLVHEAWSVWEHELLRPGLVACGYMGAVKGSSLMRACIDRIAQRPLAGQAWHCVGPGLFSKIVREHGGCHIYPSRMFLPVHHTGTPAPGDHPIYAKQYWGSTLGYDKIAARHERASEGE